MISLMQPSSSSISRAWVRVVLAAMLIAGVMAAGARPAAAQPPSELAGGAAPPAQIDPPHPLQEIENALICLPLAAVLGAALALRPKRRGTPPRHPAVIQTQIMLAVVGAVIMLVVGANLARAFAVVGVASLIRYRSKIEDPKDAVVMLCALGVGLASGVGLYALAVFSTAFMVLSLGIIESFEPQKRKRFILKVRAGKDTDDLRPKIEAILGRYGSEFELRATSDEEISYDVQVPLDVQTDRVSNSILRLDPDGHGAVEWSDASGKRK